MRSRTLSLTYTAAFLIACGGCGSGDGLPREPISGKVTLDGQPLADGMITFLPEGGGEPVVSSLVKDGAFDLSRAGGPVPGSHRVTIWAKKPTGKKIADPDDRENLIDEMRDVIPKRYNLESGLKAEVKAGADNAFAFDLSGKEEPQQARKARASWTRR